uniref:Signal recognition particle subunit SRP72 n=1 Tax=Trypanosoma congolense (strain IL3000) TaxID=1068625 RepID=G0UYT1_TRYCI|nr:putative signal recognition particle protein [Trypanosoma congolense IL3000]
MSDVAKFVRQLERLIETGTEPPRVLPAIEKILHVDPRNMFALRCKVVCLLHQDKHTAALAALDQMSSIDPSLNSKSQEFAFHKAYCHYRLMDDRQAQEVLKRAPHTSDHVPSQHLLAQAHYRQEEYEEAANIYETLLKKKSFRDEQEEAELITNYAAACTTMDVQRTQSIVRAADVKTADMLYNVATAQIEVQDYAGALHMLKQAEVACARAHSKSRLRSFEDACAKTDDERCAMLDVKGSPERLFFNDVANIWVQMAYVHHVTHHEDKAVALLTFVLKYRPASEVTIAVASTNWAAIQRHKDFFDTYRKLKLAQNPAVNSRLTSRQRVAIHYNIAMLLLHTGNFTRFKRQVELVANDYPQSDLTHALKLALAVGETKKKKHSGEKTVSEYLDNYKKSMALQQEQQQQQQRKPAVGRLLPLIAAQIFLDNGDLEHAIESLSSAADDVRQKPCTLVTLVTWRVQLGDVAGAKKLLAEYAAASQKNLDLVKAIILWSVRFLSARGLHNDGVDVILESQKVAPALQKDKETLALMALCLSHYDMQAARSCLSGIPEAGIEDWVGPVQMTSSSIAELVAHKPSRQQIESFGYRRVVENDEADDAGLKGKRSARRPRPMRRPPKNTDARIDPERWIPMSHRSYIKDLPERRKRELKRLRAFEQEQKRHQAEKRKLAMAAASVA